MIFLENLRPVFGLSLIVLTLGLVGCESSTKETPNGMRFHVVKRGDGILPKPGEIVTYNFKLIDSNDSVWIDTYRKDFPIATKIRDSSRLDAEKGLNQMLRMVSKGDSLSVNLTIKEYYKEVAKRPLPEGIDTTRSLVYHVSIDSILGFENYRVWLMKVNQRRKEIQIQKDIQVIDQYLAEKNINAEKIESGLRYVITRQGSGPTARAGQAVLVNYSGYLLDGTFFVSNVQSVAKSKGITVPVPYEPLEVIVNESSVIVGWHLALKYLNKGAKGTFYIPSPFAYGKQKFNDLIKENAILVFDLEVMDIKERGSSEKKTQLR